MAVVFAFIFAFVFALASGGGGMKRDFAGDCSSNVGGKIDVALDE